MVLTISEFISEVQRLGGIPNANTDQLREQLEELFDIEGYEDYWKDTIQDLDLPYAVEVFTRLEQTGYFKYTSPELKDLVLLYHIVWFNEEGLYNDSLHGPESILLIDRRFIFLDSEYLCEPGGFQFFLINLKLATDEMGVPLVYEERCEQDAEGKYIYRMSVNGRHYTFHLDSENFAHAALKTILIFNRELELQQLPERLYPISVGTDGAVMLLTPEQQQLVAGLIPDVQNKPLPLEEWCKVFKVPFYGDDPESYHV
ncbi:MAG: hypothetical protein JO154_08500 [Chitinophaga sp.]|nr:hypothetical protein [Chitinophaga sp.]